jgi:hypothetical protein
VNAVTASKLAADHPAERIREHVEAFDRLIATHEDFPRNPAGFLVQSIRDGYDIPIFVAQRTGEISGHRGRNGRGGRFGRRQEREDSYAAERTKLKCYLKGLTAEKRRLLEETALASAPPLLALRYEQAVSEGPELLVDVYRHLIVERHLADGGKEGRTERGRRG